ncbi:ATP-binding cassette domain-containing protein [Halobacteriovorax sp. HLS]|uniref:ATP-binding cassette domain-containing protein n=1 Tax=Halobacteriovorax sp. HLS TaxID=2234000 RepID=UPI000FD8FC3F|nr:ATP-binding cassette domain-containing protein [Halobacteriovorax sp. HLS]
MIQLNNISKSFGGQNLYEDISFTLGSKERVGLVGRNGSGKSTLFKIITGEMAYEGGSVNIPKNYKIGYLSQHLKFEKNTVLEECIQSLSEEERFDHYKAEKILSGLGFSQEEMQENPLKFSGGYQIRINLTKCLLENPNLLLLDEPTNYLDIMSLRWLRSFLKSFEGEVILITHDRDFMDDTVTHTMGLTRGRLKKIKGDTVKFYEQLLEEDMLYEQTRSNQEKKKKELMAFVDKFRAKASKATQAQSRLKQLEKMGSMNELAKEGSMALSFRHIPCPGKTICTVKDVSFGYEEENLFSGVNFEIKRNDCIGIIGKNGKGKSTLLNVITGELKARTGEIQYHPSASIGHFGQTNIKRLSENNTIVAEVTATNPELTNTEVRKICGSMMFEGDLADKKISVLSGGERSRVMLGKIIAHKSNILFLDEPTNHLDMESVEILCEKLEEFPGAIVLVTHNEMLLRRLANRLVVFRNSQAQLFEQGYDEFLDKIGWDEDELSESQGENVAPSKKNKKEDKRLRAELIQQRSRATKELKKKMDKLEEGIFSKEEKAEELNEQLISASTSGDGKLINDISQKLGVLQKVLDMEYHELSLVSDEFHGILDEFEQKLSFLDH